MRSGESGIIKLGDEEFTGDDEWDCPVHVWVIQLRSEILFVNI